MPTYESLVREYHALVFHVARGVLRDSSAAEDAAQDVFLSFLQNPAALARAANVRAFVCRAALNRALDLAKAGKRRERREALAAERSTAMDPVEAAFRSELRSRVGELPEEQRQALDLHYFRGLTLPETAEAMAIPVGTVSSRISAALAKLRTALGAAAFVALLARLETELSACEAGERVPPGLSARLMRLATGSPAGLPDEGKALSASSRAATLALGVLLMVAGLVLWWKQASAGEASRLGTAGRGNTESVATMGQGRASGMPGPLPLEAEETSAANASLRETILEGFLVRKPEGIHVWRIGSGKYGWDGEEQLEIARREAMVLANEEAVAEIPFNSGWSFDLFLDGKEEAEQAPQAWVRLRVQEVVPVAARAGSTPGGEHAERAGGADEKPAFLTLKARIHPTSVKVLEILDREVLTKEWLLAWRALKGADRDFSRLWYRSPGGDKRTQLLDAATRIDQARIAAREARAGAKAPWRIAREWECIWEVSSRLQSVSLVGVVPEIPSPRDLSAVVRESQTTAGLQASVLARWGKEAFVLHVSEFRTEDCQPFQRQTSVETLCRMGEEEYARYRERLEASDLEEREQRESWLHSPVRAKFIEAVAATGLVAEPLTSIDRERWILMHAVRVASVIPGSAADEAGFLPGDVIWQGAMEFNSKEHRTAVEQTDGLGRMIDLARQRGLSTMCFDVLRESGPVRLSLSL